MGKRESDSTSIMWAAAALWKLGCPDLRPCQGNAELEALIASPTYRRTPDMVAGAIEGCGSPNDFYIDVAELQGETLYNPRRPGGVSPPALLVEPANNHGSLRGAELPTGHFDGYLSTLNGKISKYSAERGGTPLVGLCIHLDSSALKSNAEITPRDMMKFMTRIDYVRFLEAAFGKYGGKALHEGFARLFGPDVGPAIYFMPMPLPISFLMHTVKLEAASDMRVLLLVNDSVLDGTFQSNAVIAWLRRVREQASVTTFEPAR